MMRKLKINSLLSVIAFSIISAFTNPAMADSLDVDLSKPEVELTTSFDGAKLLFFGVHNPGTDVIVIVRGPEQDTPVRRKERIAGIWVNADEIMFKKVPTFYSAASTRPPEEILNAKALREFEIGVENLKLVAGNAVYSQDDVKTFSAGLLRNMQRIELYSSDIGEIKKVGKQLFRTDLWFPSNVNVGGYIVTTHLVMDGKITETKVTNILVHKTGVEADIYNFAHDHALLYGLLAVLIAVVSGWSANAIFRKG